MLQSIDQLKQRIEDLEFENAVLRLLAHRHRTDESIYGFKLRQKSAKRHGKEYIKWYAYSFIGGKTIWIYIGDDTHDAETKIKAWLKDNLADLQTLVTQGKKSEKK